MIGSLSVSLIGLGCNQFGRKIDAHETRAVVDAALDAGINFLDTSDRYGYGSRPFSGQGRSEEFLGQALKGRRERVILATKFGNQMGDDPRNKGGSRRWVLTAVEDSLRRLQTDYIDLYQIHRPDPLTPIEETIDALNELVAQGKVREIGCCNFTVPQLEQAAAVGMSGEKRFASVQNEYSLLCREPEKGVLTVCRREKIRFLPYFPLAGGLLSGKYRKGQEAPADGRLALFPPGRPHLGLTAKNLDRIEILGKFASESGHSLLELAFAWLVAHREVASVIAGATAPLQVQQNASTLRWRLSDDELAQIDQLAGNDPEAGGEVQ